MDLSKYIAAHGQWKMRLRQVIDTGKSEWSVEGVRVDDRCEFGKFLHGLGPALGSTEMAAQIKAKHAAFHVEAARVLELAMGGKRAEAAKAIEIGSSYMRLSSELTRLMIQWQGKLAA